MHNTALCSISAQCSVLHVCTVQLQCSYSATCMYSAGACAVCAVQCSTCTVYYMQCTVQCTTCMCTVCYMYMYSAGVCAAQRTRGLRVLSSLSSQKMSKPVIFGPQQIILAANRPILKPYFEADVPIFSKNMLKMVRPSIFWAPAHSKASQCVVVG